ncbi:eukaryotic translation initiation factor 4E transporter isoform X4 [Xenopus laevis]|uniref:Eukaryotic Translation initiation factor 4E transporter isoform X4 n=1 Tax=Xenopus laevis TaxID=8355 RepID=A0A8J0V974_XENLA|nr:eukaryotic translation initiation factor 4E transporter isoform X4 [Xenopus laevis]XP_018117184.1 eukaryotic translation initiation factor 4E transporter isoform X4 [Xenopus laevis]
MDYREEADRRDSLGDVRKPHWDRSHHRYSKEELLDIKELPHSKERPSCLLDKYDSDGVWDPEKWHSSLYPNSGRSSPIEALKKDSDTERISLKRRIADPRERVKEDDLDVVLSPQRRSFGGGCHVTAAASSRRSGSPLDNKENESMRMLGSRRIGSGRIMTARGFDRDVRGGEKDREPREGRDREKEYKDKRFRREHGDSKRIFGDRRRNDSCTEEEPEWYSGGPTSQSETIELIGFDDKILEEDQKGRKRTRKRTASLKEGVECNGGVLEEVALPPEHAADQEVPEEAVLPEPAPGEFDFNEFFNLDKSVPGLASRNQDGAMLSSSDVATPSLQRNILQELLGQPVPDSSSHVLSNLMGTLDSASLLQQRSPSPQITQVFPTRASSADYLQNHIPSPIGFASGPSQFLREQFPSGVPKEEGPMMAQVSPLEMQQAALDGFIPPDIALQAANYYHPGFGTMQMDKSRENFRSRPQPRLNKSPVANMRGASLSPGPGASVTSMLSPSFTPTSVIRKMYESKEKSKDEITGKQNVSGKEGYRTLEVTDGPLPNSITQDSPQDTSPVMGSKASISQRSCTPPLPHQNRYTKDQDYRHKSTGRRTPTVSSPVPGASFLQPLHQLPIVPVVRPSHQLHPGLVQRMLAQGVPPQHLSLLQAGLLPPGIDLPPLHALSPSVLGQPFYPLSPAGHPLLNQRPPANPLQLAMMQQSMQRPGLGLHAPLQGMTNRPNMHMDQRPSQRSTSPVGLAKWFGSDVLQQPLPSMPAKVISVDELEYRQ